jgi:hypothetical protein
MAGAIGEITTSLCACIWGTFKNVPLVVTFPRARTLGRLWNGGSHIAITIPRAIPRRTRNLISKVVALLRDTTTATWVIATLTFAIVAATASFTGNDDAVRRRARDAHVGERCGCWDENYKRGYQGHYRRNQKSTDF